MRLMRRHSFLLLAAVPALFALAGCGFKAPEAKRTPPPPAPPPPLSTLATTLTLQAAAIVQELNDKTKPEIAHITNKPVDCMIAKCHLDLVATRSGPVSGAARDGRFFLTVPFSVKAHLQLKSKLFKTGADGSAAGEAQMATALALGPDWKLQTNTQGVVKLGEGKLKLGPVKMDLTDLWNHNEDHLSDPLFKAVDKHLGSALKVKAQAERLWQKAQRPIRVGKSPEAWLMLAPERIRVSGLSTVNDALVVSLAVDTRARVVVGPKPAEAKLIALPAPMPLAAASDSFAVSVPAVLPYDEAARLAMARLSAHPIHVGSTKVRFERIEILPSGQDVVVAARFCVAQGWDIFGWFDSCGEGYLRGVPVFDAKTQEIRVTNVHYDIATEGVIASAMRALAGDELGKALQTRLVFSVAHDLGKLQAQVQAALAKPQGRGVQISGTLDSFGTPALTWTKDGFLASFSAQGTIHANLNIQPPKPHSSKPESPALDDQ